MGVLSNDLYQESVWNLFGTGKTRSQKMIASKSCLHSDVILLYSDHYENYSTRKYYMNITLALGGGGAKGNSHIGVIRCLEKEGFKINAVAGTSFGGLVAVFYALGYSPDDIEEIFSTLDQSQLYGHSPDEGASLLGLAGATRWLNEVIGERTFDDLKIPCALTAADLKSGREVILSEGPLVDAVLATIAIPGIFPARHIGDLELVDGGTLNPVPVAQARLLMPKLPVVAVVLIKSMGTPAQAWNIPLPDYIPRNLLERLSRMRYPGVGCLPALVGYGHTRSNGISPGSG